MFENLGHMWRTTPVMVFTSLVGAAMALFAVPLFFLRDELFAHVAWVQAHRRLWPALMVVGFLMELGGFAAHDRWHLRRGEVPHAMWGTGDARRPKRLGGPRRPLLAAKEKTEPGRSTQSPKE